MSQYEEYWNELGGSGSSEVQIDEAYIKDEEAVRIVRHEVQDHYAYLEEHLSKSQRQFKIQGTNLIWGQPPVAEESNHVKDESEAPAHVLINEKKRPREDRKYIAELIEKRDNLRKRLYHAKIASLPWRVADFDSKWSPAAAVALRISGILGPNANKRNFVLPPTPPPKKKPKAAAADDKKTQREHRRNERQQRQYEDRRSRESEREVDRLGRLLRRAAELDVSRCCNDVRTLLYAKASCEEADLCTGLPPSVSGEIPQENERCTLNTKATVRDERKDDILHCVGLPALSFDAKLLKFAHFIHSLDLVPLTLPEILHAFDDDHDDTIHTIGLALMVHVLPSLQRFLGFVRALPLNKHTWPALARYALIGHACRELGWNDADALAYIRGPEVWSNCPEIDTTDHILVNLLRARAVATTTTNTDLPEKVIESRPGHKVKLPKPCSSIATQKSTVDTGPKAVMSIQDSATRHISASSGASVPSIFRQRIFSKKPKTEAKLSPKQAEICLNLVTQLLNNPCYFRIRVYHQLHPGPSLEHVYAALQASGYESVFEFVSDVRTFLKSKSTHPDLAADAIELLTKFETVLRAAFNGKTRILAENQPYPLICACCEDLLFDEKEAHTNPVSGLSFCPTCISLKTGPYVLDGLISTDITVAQFGSVPRLLGTVQAAQYDIKKNQASCILKTAENKIAKVEQWHTCTDGWRVTTDEPCILSNYDVPSCWSCRECVNSFEALNKRDQWIMLLTSLCEVASVTQEVQQLLAKIPDARVGSSPQLPPQTRRQSSLSGLSANGSFAAEDSRKQKESLLIARVIKSSCDYVKLGDDAEKTRPRLVVAAQKGLLLPDDSSEQASDKKGECSLCGGDFDYLNSYILKDEKAHDFCIDINASASGYIENGESQLKKRVTIPSPHLGMGRTETLGVDDDNRIYWRFPAAPTWLFVQLTENGAYLTLKTVPAQTRLYAFLQARNGKSSTLCKMLKEKYPAILTEDTNDPEEALSMADLGQHFASLVRANQHKARPQQKDEVCLVRGGNRVLWWGKGTQERMRLGYDDDCDGCCIDTIHSEDNCLEPRQEAIVTQKLLFKKKLKKKDALSYLQDTLIASHFLSAPKRYLKLTAFQVQAMAVEGSESLELRAALTLIEAALPIGAKYDWSEEKASQRLDLIRLAVEPAQLLECIIMLEDELHPTWLADRWLDTRQHLPSRTHVLRYPSFSLAALLLFSLDTCIDYHKTEKDADDSIFSSEEEEDTSINLNLPSSLFALPAASANLTLPPSEDLPSPTNLESGPPVESSNASS